MTLTGVVFNKLIFSVRYPFDSQTCGMEFQCEGNSGEFVELIPQQLQYLGPKDLTQYFIRWNTVLLLLLLLLLLILYKVIIIIIRETNISLGSSGMVEVRVVLGRWPAMLDKQLNDVVKETKPTFGPG